MIKQYSKPLLAGIIMIQALACQQTPGTNAPAVSFANTTDYICGMKVKASYDDTCHYQGKVYGFCSETCKEEFKGNPGQYITQ